MSKMVVPSHIEKILLTHGAVAEAAALGVPHPEYGESARAFVVLKPSHRESRKISENELEEFVAGTVTLRLIFGIPQRPLFFCSVGEQILYTYRRHFSSAFYLSDISSLNSCLKVLLLREYL